MTQGKRRNSLGYFNLAKGFGILFVLISHTSSFIMNLYGLKEPTNGLGNGAIRVFGAGIMGMFFIISGLSLFPKSLKSNISLQWRTVIKPYYCVTAAVMLLLTLRRLLEGRFPIPWSFLWAHLLAINNYTDATLWGTRVKYISILWFLWALAGGWVICSGILRHFSTKNQWVVAWFAAVLGIILGNLTSLWFFCFPMMLVATWFLFLGSQLRKVNLLEYKLPVWGWVLLIGTALCSLCFGFVSIADYIWKLNVLDLLGVTSISFLLVRFFAWLVEKINKNPLTNLLEGMGANSIWLVYVHAVEKLVLPWNSLEPYLTQNLAVDFLICVILRLIVVFLLYRAVTGIYKWNRKCHRRAKVTLTLE
jgi:hypothetical protein